MLYFKQQMFNIKYWLFLITKLHLSSVNNKKFFVGYLFYFLPVIHIMEYYAVFPCKHTVGYSCWLPILNIAVCARLSQTPNLSFPTSLLPSTVFIL